MEPYVVEIRNESRNVKEVINFAKARADQRHQTLVESEHKKTKRGIGDILSFSSRHAKELETLQVQLQNAEKSKPS